MFDLLEYSNFFHLGNHWSFGGFRKLKLHKFQTALEFLLNKNIHYFYQSVGIEVYTIFWPYVLIGKGHYDLARDTINRNH